MPGRIFSILCGDTMSDLAARAVMAAFTHLAKPAVFRPAEGDEVTGISVVIRQADDVSDVLGLSSVSATTVIDCLASEVPGPARGDVFVVDGIEYKVNEKPYRKDAERLVWVCPAPEVES